MKTAKVASRLITSGPDSIEGIRHISAGDILIRPLRRQAPSFTQTQSSRGQKLGGFSRVSTSKAPIALLSTPNQIFPNISSSLRPLIPEDENQPYLLENITLWGNGKVNFHRASLATLSIACEGLLTESQIFQIHNLRQEYPGTDLEKVLSLMELNQKQRAELQQLLASSSTCYSLAVASRRPNQHHANFKLYVKDTAARPNPVEYRFIW